MVDHVSRTVEDLCDAVQNLVLAVRELDGVAHVLIDYLRNPGGPLHPPTMYGALHESNRALDGARQAIARANRRV